MLLAALAGCKKYINTGDMAGNGGSNPQNAELQTALLNTVTIGTQVWMVKNLNTARYLNGDPIPQVQDPAAWQALTSGAWCWYNNDGATYGATYGKLYNWYAWHDARGLIPQGWHVPNNADWNTLKNYLGGVYTAGGHLKEAGTAHWLAPNTGATNSSGFTALPGGQRWETGTFVSVREYAHFWSASQFNDAAAYHVYIYYNEPFFNTGVYTTKKSGKSIRLVKNR